MSEPSKPKTCPFCGSVFLYLPPAHSLPGEWDHPPVTCFLHGSVLWEAEPERIEQWNTRATDDLATVLEFVIIEIEPLAKQIICPSDNVFSRVVDKARAALKERGLL